MRVALLRDARPAGWVAYCRICTSTMLRAQNRSAKGSILLWRRFALPILLYYVSMRHSIKQSTPTIFSYFFCTVMQVYDLIWRPKIYSLFVHNVASRMESDWLPPYLLAQHGNGGYYSSLHIICHLSVHKWCLRWSIYFEPANIEHCHNHLKQCWDFNVFFLYIWT